MLQIDDPLELNALWQAIFCAKFTRDPARKEVIANPYLARAGSRIREAAEVIRRRSGAPNDQDDWGLKRELLHEWDAMRYNAWRYFGDVWASWSDEERRRVAEMMAAPFGFAAGALDEFVGEVDLLVEAEAFWPTSLAGR